MSAPDLRAMVTFLRADARDRELLLAIREPWLKRISGVVDDFYDRILSDQAARHVLRDPAAVDRLRVSLLAWAEDLLHDPSGEENEWLERRWRIGTRHVEVGLPPRFMPLAMNVVRTHIHQIICESIDDRAVLAETLNAADRALDLELAIMSESYRQLADSELRKTERLATLGRLATGISHELRNPLGIINTGIHILTQVLDESSDRDDASGKQPAENTLRRDDWKPALDRISRGARQARELSSQLLEYVRARTPRIFSSSVQAVLQEGIANAIHDDRIPVEISVVPKRLKARCDAADLARALSNLISNATQIAGDENQRAKVWVEASAHESALEIQVRDNGPGVDSSIDGRIFEPLFSTRPNATGLGLAISRDLVLSQGGSLTLQNPGERGACFLIRLPDAIDDEEATPSDANS